jgi:hypothetical protein
MLSDLFLYGSLAVRDLSNLITPEDMVTSEHLVTLLSIVPKYSQKDWLASYESLDTFVVSSEILGIPLNSENVSDVPSFELSCCASFRQAFSTCGFLIKTKNVAKFQMHLTCNSFTHNLRFILLCP